MRGAVICVFECRRDGNGLRYPLHSRCDEVHGFPPLENFDVTALEPVSLVYDMVRPARLACKRSEHRLIDPDVHAPCNGVPVPTGWCARATAAATLWRSHPSSTRHVVCAVDLRTEMLNRLAGHVEPSVLKRSPFLCGKRLAGVTGIERGGRRGLKVVVRRSGDNPTNALCSKSSIEQKGCVQVRERNTRAGHECEGKCSHQANLLCATYRANGNV